MDLQLKDKVALVAASSRGLGRAVAEALAAEGASLVLCAREASRIGQVAHEIAAEHGVRVIGVAADVSKPGDIAALMAAGLKEFGRIDVLVTNAAGPPAGTFATLPADAWPKAVALTLDSVVNLCRAVLPGMKERGWGRILAINSIAAKQPVENLMLSNSVRAAVTGFLRTLANEVAPHGITVNNLLPGYTKTERVVELADANAKAKGTTPASEFAKWEGEIPMGRLAEPREFAALAAFLASERASYITAQSIAVDGGWIKGLM